MSRVNRYYDLSRTETMVAEGQHRALIGGMWDEIGRLQFDYLKKDGLTPGMRLLDIGCGCLRGGVHFVEFLEAGNYFGIDLSEDLLKAGYDIELAGAGLQHKLPRDQLRVSEEFDVSGFGVQFDAALALSVLTHLTLNHVKLCLNRLAGSMRPGARFYATVFHCPDSHDWSRPLLHEPGQIVSHPHRDPYHYTHADLAYCCRSLPWRLDRLELWDHPRHQSMAVFCRTEAPGS